MLSNTYAKYCCHNEGNLQSFSPILPFLPWKEQEAQDKIMQSDLFKEGKGRNSGGAGAIAISGGL